VKYTVEGLRAYLASQGAFLSHYARGVYNVHLPAFWRMPEEGLPAWGLHRTYDPHTGRLFLSGLDPSGRARVIKAVARQFENQQFEGCCVQCRQCVGRGVSQLYSDRKTINTVLEVVDIYSGVFQHWASLVRARDFSNTALLVWADRIEEEVGTPLAQSVRDITSGSHRYVPKQLVPW